MNIMKIYISYRPSPLRFLLNENNFKSQNDKESSSLQKNYCINQLWLRFYNYAYNILNNIGIFHL